MSDPIVAMAGAPSQAPAGSSAGNYGAGATPGVAPASGGFWSSLLGDAKKVGNAIGGAAKSVGEGLAGAGGAALGAVERNPALALVPFAGPLVGADAALLPTVGAAASAAAGPASEGFLATLLGGKKNPLSAVNPLAPEAPINAGALQDFLAGRGVGPGGTEVEPMAQEVTGESNPVAGGTGIPLEPGVPTMAPVGMKDIGETMNGQIPDVKALLSELSKAPRQDFGGRPGIGGRIADSFQTFAMDLLGHPEAGANNIIAAKRAQMAEDLANQSYAYRYASGLQDLAQRYQASLLGKEAGPLAIQEAAQPGANTRANAPILAYWTAQENALRIQALQRLAATDPQAAAIVNQAIAGQHQEGEYNFANPAPAGTVAGAAQ